MRFSPAWPQDLVLAHLSDTNNTPARACGTVHKALKRTGYTGIRVQVAMAGHPTPWIEVGQPVEAREYVYRYSAEGVARLFHME